MIYGSGPVAARFTAVSILVRHGVSKSWKEAKPTILSVASRMVLMYGYVQLEDSKASDGLSPITFVLGAHLNPESRG